MAASGRTGWQVGVWGDADDPNSTGVVGRGGIAGGYFNGSGPQSNALVLNNCGIRVVGAGGGTATPVFVQVVHDGLHGAPDNRCLVYKQATIIDNPFANDRPDAIILVTPIDYSNYPVVVSYGDNNPNCPSHRWFIWSPTTNPLIEGIRFNVMVVNP